MAVSSHDGCATARLPDPWPPGLALLACMLLWTLLGALAIYCAHA